MTQYIKKSALVAEIERRIKEGEAVVENVPSSAILGLIQAYKNVLSFIDTLEVKEIGVDLGDPRGDIGVKTVWNSSNSLEISRHGNSRNGDDLEEAATKYAQDKYLPVQTAQSFKAGAEWQKKQTIVKACEWLEEHLLNFWLQRITNTDYFIEDFKQAMNK